MRMRYLLDVNYKNAILDCSFFIWYFLVMVQEQTFQMAQRSTGRIIEYPSAAHCTGLLTLHISATLCLQVWPFSCVSPVPRLFNWTANR